MKAAPSYGLAGSNAGRELEGLIAALDRLREAQAALCEVQPNGRDYIGRPDDYATARERFGRQIRDLEAIRREVQEAAEYAADWPAPA